VVTHDAKLWTMVGVPKCGSGALQDPYGRGVLLSPAFGGRLVARPGDDWWQDAHRMDAPAGHFTFAVARDPLTRVASMYRHAMAACPGDPACESFEAFVRGMVAGEVDGGNPVFNAPQSWWLARVPGGVHRLLAFDRLAADLAGLGLHDGPFVLSRGLNSHPADPARPVAWTPALVEAVLAWEALAGGC
jgi:hypothetical protein